MFYIMEIIVQPFERGSSMQPDWNQPEGNVGSSRSSVCFLK